MTIEDEQKIDACIDGAKRSIVCMLKGQRVEYPLTVTISDPQGLIGRLRVWQASGETRSEVLETGGEPWDPDAPTFPVMMHGIDAAGTKFSCVMYDDLSPVASA